MITETIVGENRSPIVTSEQTPAITSNAVAVVCGADDEKEAVATSGGDAASQDIAMSTSIDGNLEPNSLNPNNDHQHNLSIIDNMPTVPLTNLVNKIKINISKNSVSAISSSSNGVEQGNTTVSAASINSMSVSATGIMTSAISQVLVTSSNAGTKVSGASNSNIFNLSEQMRQQQQQKIDSLAGKGLLATPITSSSSISTISTIPVLCSGGTSVPSVLARSFDNDGIGMRSGGDLSTMVNCDNESATRDEISTDLKSANTAERIVEQQVEIQSYELKSSLQQVRLQKRDKVVSGSETSGLCSIM